MMVTIDGPAGSGKSTAARGLARELGVAYLDTGATYRAVTLAALTAGVDLTDETALAELAAGLDVRLDPQPDRLRVILNGRDVSDEIRAAEVTDNSHYVARAATVRSVLVDLQRRIARQLAATAGGVVSEGRDQGSVVFPDADVKFHLDASPEVRARRRHDEMSAAGESASYESILQAIVTRDDRDRGRPVAPLVKPQGCIEIDTTNMTVEQMVAELARVVRARS